jgi:hypothetical protein
VPGAIFIIIIGEISLWLIYAMPVSAEQIKQQI